MSMRAPPPEFQRDLRATSLRLILLLGVASLFGSLVSNGARSVTGPYLLLLGGSAAVVGLVAGAGPVAVAVAGAVAVPGFLADSFCTSLMKASASWKRRYTEAKRT